MRLKKIMLGFVILFLNSTSFGMEAPPPPPNQKRGPEIEGKTPERSQKKQKKISGNELVFIASKETHLVQNTTHVDLTPVLNAIHEGNVQECMHLVSGLKDLSNRDTAKMYVLACACGHETIVTWLLQKHPQCSESFLDPEFLQNFKSKHL